MQRLTCVSPEDGDVDVGAGGDGCGGDGGGEVQRRLRLVLLEAARILNDKDQFAFRAGLI